jgi:hypothetical protein
MGYGSPMNAIEDNEFVNFDEIAKNFVAVRDDIILINYDLIGENAHLCVNSAEYWTPLIYSLGSTKKNEVASFF